MTGTSIFLFPKILCSGFPAWSPSVPHLSFWPQFDFSIASTVTDITGLLTVFSMYFPGHCFYLSLFLVKCFVMKLKLSETRRDPLISEVGIGVSRLNICQQKLLFQVNWIFCRFCWTHSPLELHCDCFSKIAEVQENRFYSLKVPAETLVKNYLAHWKKDFFKKERKMF